MKKSWSNTMLVAYSSLPKIVHEIDFGVSTRVKSSFRSVHLKNGVSTEDLIREIVELNEEKRKIINLRVIVADALLKLPEFERKILICRIMQKFTFQRISDDFKIPIRSAFRKVAEAEDSFESNLKTAGYDESWLENEYGGDKYIAAIHARVAGDKYFVAKNM